MDYIVFFFLENEEIINKSELILDIGVKEIWKIDLKNFLKIQKIIREIHSLKNVTIIRKGGGGFSLLLGADCNFTIQLKTFIFRDKTDIAWNYTNHESQKRRSHVIV